MKTIQIECASCGGTGLYQGMCEHDGAAVECSKCGGTGAVEFSYNEFTGRKVRSGVQRVYADNGGYSISAQDTMGPHGQMIHFSQFGCSYGEWLAGTAPAPIKELLCPNLVYHSTNPLPNCSAVRVGYSIPHCPYYDNKAACWEEYEKLNGPV